MSNLKELKFVCDRMLGRLAIWLRLSGYDTICLDDSNLCLSLNTKKEDTYLVEHFTDRILLTRDRELYLRRMKKGYPVKLVKSMDIEEQLKEISILGVRFYPVMKRCTICNTLLKKPSKEAVEEIVRREGLGEHILKKELWYCENCKKLYWVGSHWKNMLKFLKKCGLIE